MRVHSIIAMICLALAVPGAVFAATSYGGGAVASPSAVVNGQPQAAATHYKTIPNLPKVLASMTKTGALRVIRQFKTPLKSVTGYLVNQRGHYSIVYGIDGYVLTGAFISPTGSNLTTAYNNQYAPRPAYARIIESLHKNGHLIRIGSKNAKHVLYAFEDPNCIFCHKLSLALDPYIKSGKVRVNIVLVSFVHANSMGKSTAILSARNPGAAWAENEAVTKYDTHTEEGNSAVQNPPDPRLAAVVRQNMLLMGKAGFSGTPGILYRASNGKWDAVNGFPGDAWLVQQFGKP